MTSLVQRVAQLGRRDGRLAFLRVGPEVPAQAVAEAWLHGRRRQLVAHVEQQLYVFAFIDAFHEAAEGRRAHTQKES